MTAPLSTAARIVADLRERLKAEYALDDDDQAMTDTLEGATDLPEMLAKMAREAVEAEKRAEAVWKIQADNTARAARLNAKAKSLRAQIAWALQEAGMKRIPEDALPDMTVTMRAGKAPLIIDEEGRVPFTFVTVKTVESVDKAAIREALEAGEKLDFARLGNPAPVLSIRTK